MTSNNELTLEQKASLLSGNGFWATKAVEDAGIPALVLTDGPHGVRRQPAGADELAITHAEPATCFPPAVAVGSSWDPAVAAEIAKALGVESRALGVHVLLGPGINLKRSPLCGRNFEYYSEDPYLTGVLATAHVRGVQSQGVGASLKHFAANNQETARMSVSADVDERTLRELYLAAFDAVVTDAQPATVMCAYNKVNGVYASEHRWLLTEVLREEWGFTGVVVSDWGAVHNRVAALAAGLDLEMPGTRGVTDQQVVAAVRAGDLDESFVDESARRVIALGRLAAPATGAFDVEAHHELASRLAAECAVLLKNQRDVLPLEGIGSLLVVGEFATTPRYQGGGSSHINATMVDRALDAISTHASARGQKVRYEQELASAVSAAAEVDVAVVFAGLHEEQESEGFDRTSLDLPAAQVELIRAVAAAAPRTVVVLSHGGVMSLEGWHDEVDAILDCFLLGQGGGSATADLLYGEANPSGHLAETIPVRLEDTPAFLNFPGEQGHVRYGEGVMVGYRYYETVLAPVRYPFGHGLSYTTFRTSDLSVEVTGDASVEVRVTVTNTGSRPGKHVVQVYVSPAKSPVRRPRRELRGFTKIALEPGEAQTVTIDLAHRAFAYWDVELHRWVAAPGEYGVEIGESAADIVASRLVTLRGDVIVPVLTLDSSVAEWFAHPSTGPAVVRLLRSALAAQGREMTEEGMASLQMVDSMPMQQLLSFLGGSLTTDDLVALLPVDQAIVTA